MHKASTPNPATLRRQSIGNAQGLVHVQSLTLTDLQPFTAHWRRLLVGRCFQEYGSLLFSPSDMCPYVYNAHISDRLHTHKKKRLKKSKASRRNLLAAAQLNDNNNDEDDDDGDNESEITPLTSSRHFVRAFHLWRDMCAALCHASVLDSTSDSSSASFHVKHTKQALAHGRQAMWNSACGMAREKECANNTSIDLLTSRGTYLPPSTSLESHMLVTLLCVDVRPSLFQVLNFESAAIANIFRDEGDAETELVNVRRTFQVNDSCFRLLYTRAGPDTKYALTVDELWRAMKRLRVVTQLVPTPRDDDSAEATQVISVVEFAELLLRICNEQFGELGRLGQRVDRFVVEHLCFLQQAKSTLREEAQNPAMKLLSPRFTYEAAHDLFRNVQEGASHEDDMEMVYAEFCEAIVALAGFQLPDPFMDWPVKTSTFIHRYLCDDVAKD
ncbi:hypothetical protein B5M09_009706 [Aphanomyces astaci]|uniref:Uncharacterized protein n=1 Tax=Aphanomyces astaci TaxID=112090 RepID=A0A425DGZ2_APHAT|nr:hypothetical protein B5M09_009706 [Aphanomyces astaci]